MRRRLLIFGLVFVPVVVWGLLTLQDYTVGVHKRNVMLELSDWKSEYSKIKSQHDAVRTAEMLEYAQSYYLPGEGYRSSDTIESALHTQRQETIDAFVLSLREYTKKDFGDDSEKWLTYLRSSTPTDRPIGESTDFSKLLDTLSAEHSRDDALAAHRELVAAGKQAFPELLMRLDDETITHIEFLGSVSTTDPPPIGQVCFEILLLQLEGRWPKGFRQYRILDKSNISEWVEHHLTKSLPEMRHIALTQAIQNVNAQPEVELERKYASEILRFLREKKSFIDEPEFDFGKPLENPFDDL